MISNVNCRSLELMVWPVFHFQGFSVIVIVLSRWTTLAGSRRSASGHRRSRGRRRHETSAATLPLEVEDVVTRVGRRGRHRQDPVRHAAGRERVGDRAERSRWGVPAAGIIPTEPGCVTDVEVALPLWQEARAVTLATARASPPMRLVPNLMIAPPHPRHIRSGPSARAVDHHRPTGIICARGKGKPRISAAPPDPGPMGSEPA